MKNEGLLSIIGKRVVAIKSWDGGEPDYVLFDDGETYIQFSEQDSYDYHDCCSRARTVDIYCDKRTYDNIMNGYKDATRGEFF